MNTQLLNDKSKQYEVSSNFNLYLPLLPWLFWIIYMFVGATGIYHSKNDGGGEYMRIKKMY